MKTSSYDGKWKGEVIFYDPLTIPQEAEWEYALSRLTKAQKDGGGASAVTMAILPGIIACVSEWKLKGFPEKVTVDNFPSRPTTERMKLLTWLVEQITDVYKEEDDPNE
jgi:hypothetical protein